MAVSYYPRRTVNFGRLLLLILAVGGVLAAGYAIHRMQVEKNAITMLRTAQNTRKVGDLNEALALYERYLNFRPRDTSVLSEYAEAMNEAVQAQPKRIRELFDVYERVLSSDPSRNEDRRKLIEKYLAANAFSRAQSHLESLMKQNPALVDDPQVMEQYALCAQRLGESAKAIERYRTAIDSGKASSDAYLRLADLLQSDGGPGALEESKKLLDRLAAERPKDPAARLARAKYFLARKQPAEAVRELQTALAAGPDAARMPEIVFTLANLHVQDRNLPAARDVFAQAVAVSPDNVRYRVFYSDVLIRLKDKPAAEQQLHEAARLAPDNDPLAIDIIDRMIDRLDLPAARVEIERRFGDKPDPVADYLHGKLALAIGTWPEAQMRLSRALPGLEKMPKILARTHEALGHCAKAANNPDRMLACYTAALAADPTLDSARLGQAEANARLGRNTEAAATFRQFAADSPDARLMLARVALMEQLAKPADRRDWSAFDQALGQPPLTPALELCRIEALKAQSKSSEALAAAKSLAEKNPDWLAGQLALATLQTDSDPKAALATLAAVQNRLGDKAEIRLARAIALASADKPDIAAFVALADSASDYSPDERFALNVGLGNLLVRRLAKPTEAIARYQAAAQARPTDVTCRLALLDLFLELNRLDEADIVIEELQKIEGSDGPAYLFARIARQAIGLKAADAAKIADLRAKMTQVLAMRPTWGRAALLAAELADAAGDGDGALEKYRRAFTLGERRPAAVQRLVALLVARRRFDDASRILAEAEQSIGLTDEMRRQGSLLDAVTAKPGTRSEDVVKRTADSKIAGDQLFRGQWFLVANRPKDALAAYEKALEVDSENPEAWLGAMLAAAALRDKAASQAMWEKAKSALTAKPPKDSGLVARILGIGREALGDYAGAEQIYRGALKADPSNAPLLVQLAMLYKLQGRLADAVSTFRTLLATNAPDTLKRQARREIAYSLVSQGGLAQMPAALELLGQNAPPDPDDVRMTGLVISFDPFRRLEARKLLDQAAALAAPGQDDALRLAEFAVKDNDLSKAEDALREGTRGGATVPIGLHALLHQVQIKLGKGHDARQTLERLMATAPQSWEATVELARAAAAQGDKADAAKKILAHPLAADASAQFRVVVPLLLDMQCDKEAEDLLRSIVSSTQIPNRHASLVLFLAGQNRCMEATRAALALTDAEYPAPLKARLLAATIFPMPRAIVPDYDHAEWDKLTDQVNQWLIDALAKSPNDPQILTLQGVLADARGNSALALESFEKAVAIDPKAETAANSLAFLLTDTQPERAESIINRLIEQVGPKPSLLDTRARIRLARGNTIAASADIEAAIAQSPLKAVYWFRSAQVRDQLKDISGRDLAFLKAVRQLGLKKESLHPTEWAALEQMTRAVMK